MWLFIPYYLKQCVFVWCRCVFYRDGERGMERGVFGCSAASLLPPPPVWQVGLLFDGRVEGATDYITVRNKNRAHEDRSISSVRILV